MGKLENHRNIIGKTIGKWWVFMGFDGDLASGFIKHGLLKQWTIEIGDVPIKTSIHGGSSSQPCLIT